MKLINKIKCKVQSKLILCLYILSLSPFFLKYTTILRFFPYLNSFNFSISNGDLVVSLQFKTHLTLSYLD
jgi:hypothetical protein